MRVVKSADTVDTAWHAIVGEFDSTVLERKRKEDGVNPSQWTLKVRGNMQWTSKAGPVCQVSKVLEHH